MKILKVRAFTNPEGLEGNPAGVVLNSQALSTAERLKIAAQLGFSETAFHFIDEAGTDHLEFFTPTKRINNCGHATIATFGALSPTRKEGDYIVKISGEDYTIRLKNGQVGLRQRIKSIQEVTSTIASRVSKSLSLNVTQLKNLNLVDNGVRFLVLELEDLETLINLAPDFNAIKKLSLELDLVGYYLHVKDQNRPNHFYTRMFGPAYGIPEESATGMGAICLMGVKKAQEDLGQLTITQGKGMNPPGLANLELNVEEDFVWVYGSYSIESEFEHL